MEEFKEITLLPPALCYVKLFSCQKNVKLSKTDYLASYINLAYYSLVAMILGATMSYLPS